MTKFYYYFILWKNTNKQDKYMLLKMITSIKEIFKLFDILIMIKLQN